MPHTLPIIYLARHGETEWSLSGQHTGLTDLPLTDRGQQNARQLGPRLAGIKFAHVFTSPLQRASKTCELAGFKSVAETLPDLVEWNYGDYEGLTTATIRQNRPEWEIFRDGCPNGETAVDVAKRADCVIAALRTLSGNALVFSSSHFLRVFAARWLGQEPALGRHLVLGTAALSIIGYDHTLQEPVIRLWNQSKDP